MKTPSLSIGLMAVALGLVLTSVPRLFAEDKDCKIRVQFKRVLMPLTTLTPADAKALDGILKNYDKSLYKIVKFEKGVKVTGSEKGNLKDEYICEKAAILAAAKVSGASGVAIQVAGLGCQPACNVNFDNDKLAAKVETLLKTYCPQKR